MMRSADSQSFEKEGEHSKTELSNNKDNSTLTEKDLKNHKNATNCKEDESEKLNFSSLVAAHYNSSGGYNIEKRNDSRIVYLRNFNNWIKSILIKDAIYELPEQDRRNFKVLDMCCGKGGDLLKWTKQGARYMICTDIAENSLEHYKNRYNDFMGNMKKYGKYYALECEFIPADCTRVRLRGKYKDPSVQLEIVSCQFSFHYCFESLPQAECMLKNISECLKPGGIFIGTIPNANEIVKRLRQCKSKCFKNDVFSLEMSCDEPYPLFGAKYNFFLEGVVNCPEFLVHFPTFEKLAEKYGLKLIQSEKFGDFFEKHRRTRVYHALLKKMKALETYPAGRDGKLLGPSEDYTSARHFCELNNLSQVGTLSKSEWEVVSLYQTFIFKKVQTKQ